MIWIHKYLSTHCNLNEQSIHICKSSRKGWGFLQISGKFNECILHASIKTKYWSHTLMCDFLDSLAAMLD